MTFEVVRTRSLLKSSDTKFGNHLMVKTRLSLFYLGSYLFIIGGGLLVAPDGTLKVLQSTGNYGDVFPRVSGMLMSGLGLSIFGIIRERSYQLYPATLLIRVYFIACIGAFYAMTRDPLFLVLIAIVGLGLVLTLASYLSDRKKPQTVCNVEAPEPDNLSWQ